LADAGGSQQVKSKDFFYGRAGNRLYSVRFSREPLFSESLRLRSASLSQPNEPIREDNLFQLHHLSDFQRVWDLFERPSFICLPTGVLGSHGEQQFDVVRAWSLIGTTPPNITDDGFGCYSVKALSDGSIVAGVFTATGTVVRIWDQATGDFGGGFHVDNELASIDCSGDGRYVLSVSHQSMVAKVWSLPKRELLLEQELQSEGFIEDVAVSSNGKMAAIAWSESALVLTLPDLKEVWSENVGFGEVAFTPDEHALYLTGQSLYSLDLGTRRKRVLDDLDRNPSPRSLCCTNDGQRIAIGFLNGGIQLFDIPTGTVVDVERGEGSFHLACYALAFSEDNQYLAYSQGATGTISVWSAASEEVVSVFRVEDKVRALSFSPKGDMLFSGTGPSLRANQVNGWIRDRWNSERNHMEALLTANDGLAGTLEIPIDVEAERYDARSKLISWAREQGASEAGYPIDWTKRPYDQVFRVLDKHTRHIREATIHSLQDHLEDQRFGHDAQVGVFGLSIPIRAVATVGIWCLFGLLGFFVLHLRSLRKRISAQDRAWSVAWIVLYADPWVAAAAYLSVFGASILATVVVLRSLSSLSMSGGWNTWSIVVWAVLFNILSMTACQEIWETRRVRANDGEYRFGRVAGGKAQTLTQ